jgi:AraC family ethanolamine operon transcriptional activator
MKTLSIPSHQPFKWLEFEMNEFEHFKNMVESWKLDFLQMDSSNFYAQFKQILLPNVQVGYTQMNGHLEQKGYSPEEMWTFVILHKNSSMLLFNHVSTETSSTMVLYPPGSQINAVTYDGFHIYTFSIAQEHLRKITNILGLSKIEEKLCEIDRVELNPDQADNLRNQLESILGYASTLEEEVFNTEELEMLLYLLPVKFLKAMHPHMECSIKRLPKEKHLLYLEARTYMHTHIGEDITVKSIAKTFNLTERTLQNYFKKELNISPKRYLMVLRLTKIHQILKKSRVKKGLIADTAQSFGFFHMGQFAQSYKDFFGELPSHTLKMQPI